jgi:hypothetical protein
MGDAVLADPRGQKQLPIDGGLIERALDMGATSLWPEVRQPEGIESGVVPRPVELSTQNVRPKSMVDVMRLVDAWIAAKREVRAFDDALGINLRPERNKRRYEEAEWDVAPRQAKFPRRHEQRNEDLGPKTTFLAHWQVQSPIPQQQKLACRAAVAEPGSQTPGVAVNGVALQLPHIKLPFNNQGATASGSHTKKILYEVSAGTNLWQHARRRTVYAMEYKWADSNKRHPRDDPCTSVRSALRRWGNPSPLRLRKTCKGTAAPRRLTMQSQRLVAPVA